MIFVRLGKTGLDARAPIVSPVGLKAIEDCASNASSGCHAFILESMLWSTKAWHPFPNGAFAAQHSRVDPSAKVKQLLQSLVKSPPIVGVWYIACTCRFGQGIDLPRVVYLCEPQERLHPRPLALDQG